MNPIRQNRTDAGLTRAQFSQKTGIAYSTLTALEHGFVNSMREGTLQALSEFTGQTPDGIQEQYQSWKAELRQA